MQEYTSHLMIAKADPNGSDPAVEIHLVSWTTDDSEQFGLFAQHEGDPNGVMVAHFLPDVPFEVTLATLLCLNSGNVEGMTLRAAQVAQVGQNDAPDGAEQEG